MPACADPRDRHAGGDRAVLGRGDARARRRPAGGRMSHEARARTLGAQHAGRRTTVLHDDLGLTRTAAGLATAGRWVEERTAQLMAGGISWRPGAAQAARRLARPAGLRRHQRHRHARPAGGGGRAPASAAFVVHQHDQRLRPGADAGGRRAGGVDHRGRRPACRGTSTAPRKVAAEDLCELVAPRPRPAVPWSCAPSRFFPEAGRHATTCAAPTPTPTSRSTSCSTGASTSPTSSAPTWLALERAPRDRLRPLHRQRDDAVHARRTSPSCAATRPPWCARLFPDYAGRVRARAAGGCSPASTGSTSTPGTGRSCDWDTAV